MEMPSGQIVSKGEFARLLNVSPGRISQYIAAGQITRDAIEGEGRNAKIIVDKARAQLTGRLDVAQRVGSNGMTTRLGASSETAETPPASQQPQIRFPTDIIAEQIAREKLEQAKFQTARAKRDEALAVGRYMLTEDVRAQMTKAVSVAFRVMDSGLADMAAALAAHFDIPQRDVQHHLQKAFRAVRVRAAGEFKSQAADEPLTVEDDLGVADRDDEAA